MSSMTLKWKGAVGGRGAQGRGEAEKGNLKKHTTVKSDSFYANKLFMERKQKGRDYRKGQHWQGSDLVLKTGKSAP